MNGQAASGIWRGLVLSVLAGGAVAAFRWGPGYYAKWTGSGHATARQQAVKFATVQRGDLRIVIVEDGSLRAIRNHAIAPTLRRQMTIAWLVPEGTEVRKGDKLVGFEKKALEDQLRQYTADLEGQLREVVIAEKSLEIQYASSASSRKAAETRLRDAEEALRLYRELEAPKKVAELDAAITAARTKYADAQRNLTDVQKQLDDQLFVEEKQRENLLKQLATARTAVSQAEKQLNDAIKAQKTYRRYDYPRTMRSKVQALENAELDQLKANVAATNEVNQKQQSLRRVQDTIARLQRNIEELNQELERCTLYAPADGMVIYGDPQSGPYYYQRGQMQVGSQWYGNNVMMTIPDQSEFEVVFSLGEEYRGKVNVGARATITADAIPGVAIEGTLKKIEGLARPRIQWDPQSPKVFQAVIAPSTSVPTMSSGMTTRVEIVAEVVENVLMVPVEAVFNEDGAPVCYVRGPDGSQRRQVGPGKSNDSMVEIRQGLAEGEQVDLAPVRTASGDGGGTQPATPQQKQAPDGPQPAPGAAPARAAAAPAAPVAAGAESR